jgi:uncharacterized RDD family membrane protein YckC
MKTVKILTPENIDIEYSLADIGSRSAAAIIDLLVQGVFLGLLVIALILLSHNVPLFWSKYYGWIIGFSLLLTTLISYGYFIVMELSMNGATFGKKILKLRVIRNNGQPITLKHSIIRNLFRLFIDLYGIGLIMILFTRESKRLGDYAASTIVVATHEKNIPIDLESLKVQNEHFSYYISSEEQELLRDYFARKQSFKTCEALRQQLKLHFTDKFESQGILKEWESFIDSL